MRNKIKEVKNFILKKYNNFFWKDRKKIIHGIDSPDKNYYVIRRKATNVGLFSLFDVILGHIKYAADNNMIPVIDMQNYHNTYLANGKFRKENSWDYYFNQPSGVSVNQLKYKKNIFLNNGEVNTQYLYFCDALFLSNNPKELNECRDLSKKYISFSNKAKEYIQKEYERLFKEETRVLGVLCRGTDYVGLKPSGHPIQPDLNVLINKIKETMKNQHCTKIFLATEDKNNYDVLKNEFKDILFTNNHILYENTGKKFLNDVHIDRNDNDYLKGLEYMTTIVLLSRCNCLVAGNTSGSAAALILANNYDYSYVFDLGTY